MSEKMIELYKQLNINEKRNEFSLLIEKLDYLVSQIMTKQGIENNIEIVKNYNSVSQKEQTEDDMMLFFYEDLWNIKSKVLAILADNSGGK